MRKTGFTTLLLAYLFAVSTGMPVLAADDESPATAFRRLRRDLLIGTSLPPAARGFRQEHLQFLQAATAFIERLSPEDETDKPFLFAARASRGMLLMHCGRLVLAREDFTAALQLFPDVEGEDKDEDEAAASPVERGSPDLPLGAPDIATVKLYRAFTFAAESPDKFVEEVGKLPETDVVVGSKVLQETIRSFAEALVARHRYEQAIVVYGIIQKYSLWDEDRHQDPQRVIELLQIRKQHQGGL